MKLRIIENVKHNGVLLNLHEVYDFSEQEGKSLLNAKVAELVPDDYKFTQKAPEVQPPVTPKFDAKVEGYKAEATPTRPLKEEEVDNTPVVAPVVEEDKELPKAEKTVVYDDKGNVVPEEEVEKAQRTAASGTMSAPTPEEVVSAPVVE